MANILLIDDKDYLLEVTEAQLISDAHKITTTMNGEEALKKIQDEDFDLVISDFDLEQDINGVDIVKEVVKKGVIAVLYSGTPHKIQLPENLVGEVTILKKPIENINLEVRKILAQKLGR
jgi:DNA-binding NtrC family response regulator